MNEGVSINNHRGFDTEEEVLNHFIEGYPHIKNMADIRFMNENALLEASNLNNPCQHMRDAMARSSSSSQHLKEAFHTEGLTPEVRTKRAPASATMHAKGIQPEDSYNFFDAHHPRRRQIGIDISPMQNLMDPTGEA